ncbi:hypothetical protein ISS07_00010 [Candidatus Woesearchaeota archaeon]|nr:hypothetical protein [Candidatus Woesearchaeota archaeon]
MKRLILILAILIFIVGCGPEDSKTDDSVECGTRECFLQKAANCETSEYTSTEDFGTIKYQTEDCTLTKTLVRLSEDDELKDLIEGKSMTCEYNFNGLKNAWVDSLIEDVEGCEGELKEILGQLMVLV